MAQLCMIMPPFYVRLDYHTALRKVNVRQTWSRGGLPRRPCLSSGNEPFARGQWDCALKAPPYHSPGYSLLRSGPDGTSTFRCPRPSVSLPSEQYLWPRGSAPKQGDIRSNIDRENNCLNLVTGYTQANLRWIERLLVVGEGMAYRQ